MLQKQKYKESKSTMKTKYSPGCKKETIKRSNNTLIAVKMGLIMHTLSIIMPRTKSLKLILQLQSKWKSYT